MVRPTVNDIRALGDFATSIYWNIDVLVPPLALPLDGIGINFRAISSDIPKKTGTSAQVQIRGLVPVSQPGIYIPAGVLNITSIETTIDSFSASWMAAWREICYQTGTGLAGDRQSVEATLRLTRQNRQGFNIWQYTLIGVYLEDYTHGDQLQNTSADPMNFTASLRYTDFDEGPAIWI